MEAGRAAPLKGTSSKGDVCKWRACRPWGAYANMGVWRGGVREGDIGYSANVPATGVDVHERVAADVLRVVDKAVATVAAVLACAPWRCVHSGCSLQ